MFGLRNKKVSFLLITLNECPAKGNFYHVANIKPWQTVGLRSGLTELSSEEQIFLIDQRSFEKLYFEKTSRQQQQHEKFTQNAKS